MNPTIHRIQHLAFDYATWLAYLLYALTILGVWANAPGYLDSLLYYTKLYVGIFLVMRFNPYRRIKMTELDYKIAFNAGVFLITADLVGKLRLVPSVIGGGVK